MEAPAGLVPLSRPLMTAEVLDGAFRLFRAGLLRCLPYSGLTVLVLELPALHATFFRGSFGGAANRAGGHMDRYLVPAISMLLGIALIGVLAVRLSAVSRGLRPRFRAEVITVLRRWPAGVIATAIALAFTVALLGVV